MELFNAACMIRPETARPAPAMTAASTRDTLIFQMMRLLASVPPSCQSIHCLSKGHMEGANNQASDPQYHHSKDNGQDYHTVSAVLSLKDLQALHKSFAYSIYHNTFIDIIP